MAAPGPANLRSLRYRVLVLVVAMVVLPLVWVWVGGTFERGDELYQRRVLHEAASDLVAAIDAGRPVDPVVERAHVRLRVLDPDGRVVSALDRAVDDSLLAPVSRPFWGPSGRPSLDQADAHAPPLDRRPEVAASADGPAERCEVAEEGRMLVCAAARRTADGRIVHVMRGSPRLVRSLYEERFQLTALTLIVLSIGVGAALWLGWRMVRPIEGLRDQVVARTAGRLSTEPVVMDRPDEVGELAAAFNQLLRALDERNRANTVFAADLAHELKNPVAAVRAAAEALGSDRPVEGERKDRLLRVLLDASGRMDSVVHQFLELARAEAGLPDAAREGVDLGALVGALAEAARADARYGHLRLSVETAAAPVRAVPERLETATRNLLANALDFARGSVTLRVRRDGAWVELQVDDDGPGIPPEARADLFTRYRSTRRGGTGLGLPLTKAIVEAHGGTIWVGEPAVGASFVVRLPAG
ncbi:MAG: HAMP domain-containing sensor histidine kinase [Myxococcota bacterium]